MSQMTRLVWYGISVALVLTTGLAAQSVSVGPQDTATDATLCDQVALTVLHSEVLRNICLYALTIPKRMPNFTCQQETLRLVGEPLDKSDTIIGIVTYEDGGESYHDLMQNGRPLANTASLQGSWSAGQFGNHLRRIFDGRNKVEFQFTRENRVDGHSVWEFTYHIAHQDVPAWRLQVPNQMATPPYYGKFWIDQRTGSIQRLEVQASEIPTSFPMRTAKLEIDYQSVLFSDGTSFVLPVKSVFDTTANNGIGTRNIQRFQNCQKFRATSRIVPR